MTIKDIELIKEMLKMQAKLDEAIMKEYGLYTIDEEKLSFAILDEVGELTHELKGNWCYWKKTQPPVDGEKVLGELVDIWHFVLSWQNNFNGGEEGLLTDDEIDMVNHPPHYVGHGIEPIEFIESHNLNFCLGSAVKYIARAPYKGTELEDLKKAKWFLEREIKKHDKQ